MALLISSSGDEDISEGKNIANRLKLNTMADNNLLKLKGRTIYFSYRGEITNM